MPSIFYITNFRDIFNGEIIYELSPNGVFTFVSDTVNQLGYSPRELVGKHFRELICSEDYGRVSRASVLPQFKGKTTGEKEKQLTEQIKKLESKPR